MVLVAATVLTASACNSNRGTSSTGSTSAGVTTATSASSTSSTFGTLASPCGPGSAHGATEQGVTDTSIRIGYGDDRGFSQSPGLDQEMGDAVTALIK